MEIFRKVRLDSARNASEVEIRPQRHGTLIQLKDMDHEAGYRAAVDEAKAGAEEGGVPIGACLVSKDGKLLGRGRNMRVQKGSATLHVRPSRSRSRFGQL